MEKCERCSDDERTTKISRNEKLTFSIDEALSCFTTERTINSAETDCNRESY